ncbi:MAG: primase C-terminal domain-containing protein [Oscillospiraceae bacterium]|nr:primase C-terminal domain-containing protein [Oscillospiraceae bacterium]
MTKGRGTALAVEGFLSHGDSSEIFTPIPLGSRNSTLHRFAVKTLKRYGECDRAQELFLKEAQRCDPPLGERELRSIWQSAAKFYGNTIEASAGYVSPEDYGKKRLTLKPYDYTDIGQARVVVREYGEELCYTDSTDYLRYNGTCWVESRQQAVGAMEEFLDLQLADAEDQIADAVKTLEMLTGETFDLSSGVKGIEKQAGAAARKLKDDEQEKAVEQLLKELNEASAYRAFVLKRRDMNYVLSALAAAKPMVQRNVTDLDRDEFLLNTPDATYDLRYGMAGAMAHEPKNYITKVTAVNPSEKGKEEWLQALDIFFCGDAELIRYVQQIAGLAAIGKVFLEAIIIAYGAGRNGKSTFFNTVSRVMGTYAGQMSADTLTVGVRRNVKPEMAELKGKRLVIAAELEEGMRLNTSMIKQLCSTDEIFAEKKYKDPFRFIPSHTLVLYTNHLPKVGASDDGTWRRLIVIPFNAKIEGSSDIKNYTDYLVKNCGEYVLQWIIEGAEMVIANGFDIPLPGCVQQAIQSYRDNNDWLNNFLGECCEVGKEVREKSGCLYQEYREYCVSNGEWARSTTDFYAALEQAGFERKKCIAGNYILGLRLKPGPGSGALVWE